MLIVKVGCLAAGALACGLAVWLQRMNRKAAEWPMVEGVIIRSELEQDSDGDSSARISYRYRVQGRDYESGQFSYTGLRNDLPAKRERLARYPLGERVRVFYDPLKPGRAVLEREESSIWLGILATGLVFVGVGLFLL